MKWVLSLCMWNRTWFASLSLGGMFMESQSQSTWNALEYLQATQLKHLFLVLQQWVDSDALYEVSRAVVIPSAEWLCEFPVGSIWWMPCVVGFVWKFYPSFTIHSGWRGCFHTENSFGNSTASEPQQLRIPTLRRMYVQNALITTKVQHS